MLKYIYATVLLIMGVMMLIFSAYISRIDKTRLSKTVQHLELCAAVTVFAYALAITMPFELLARIMYAVYYAATDWLLVYMLLYSAQYTSAYKNRKVLPRVVGALTGIDSIFIAINAFTEWSTEFGYTIGLTGGRVFAPVAFKWPFILHRVVIYGLTTLIVVTLIYKMKKSPKMYRRRYSIMLAAFLLNIAMNVLTSVLHLNLEVSVACYILVAVGSVYYSGYYIPTGLIEDMLSSVAMNTDDCIICYDIDGKCVFANDNAKRLLDAFNDESELTKYYKISLDARGLYDKNESSWNSSRTVGDYTRYYRTTFKRLMDSKARFLGCLFMIADETDDVMKLQIERYRNTHDELTGIYNKSYFYKRASEVLQESRDGTYCMVVSDIKDFKLINDIFGVEVGDNMLVKSAGAIKKFAKEGTVFGRLSGDRFAILMPQERFKKELFADNINRIGFIEGTDNYHAHIHVGVYNIENNDMDVSVICDRAILAIKSIKSSYTDVIALYDDALRENRIGIQKLTGEFSQALEDGQFCIFIQPQTSAADGKVLGGEALVRWKHPERGMVPPAEFISVFEMTGLISSLDKYVWELVCKQLRKWKDEGRENYHISVNISPKDFFFTDIYETFTGLVEKYDIDPKNLRLEITETAIMNDVKKQIELINKLRAYGFAVEMDDFGSGYSSLNTLKDIYFDTLKIDMGFLRKTENIQRSRTILDNIILLSKQLGMEVITEGVETEEQISFLRDAGCDIFQGYYFAKPMPVKDFEEKYFGGNKAKEEVN